MGRWSLEARKKQSQLIHQWKPWKQSTGAKTEQGKAINKMNAYKHGGRCAVVRNTGQMITNWTRFLININESFSDHG